MGKANFSDEFKRDAVVQITERDIRHPRFRGGAVPSRTRFTLGSGSSQRWRLAMRARTPRYGS